MNAPEISSDAASRRTAAHARHAVQFYEGEPFLFDRVADFIAGGIHASENVVLIATGPHRSGFDERLGLRGFDVADLAASGRVIWIDARETLASLMGANGPDERRFLQHIGDVFQRASDGGSRSLRAYGEMVDLLWRDGDPGSAIRLEELWNDFARHHVFALLCAYPIGNFYRQSDEQAFRDICDRHRHVLPAESFTATAFEDANAREIVLLQRRAAALEAEIAQRKELEEQNAFLLDATIALSGSLDYASRLTELARLVVPRLADWCAVDIARADGSYDRIGLEHVDPARAGAARETWIGSKTQPDSDPVSHVIATGEPSVVSEVTDEDLAQLARDREQLAFLRSLGIRSWLIVPMRFGARTVGAITLVSAESGRRYSESDLPLPMELARRAATAIENARLYGLAQQANRAKDEFLATLSHELRTPLTAILGWARMLTLGNLDDETTRTALVTIERSARTQANLIDDLLDLSKIVTGKITLRTELVDLGNVVDNAVQTVLLAAEAKGIAIDAVVPQDTLVVRGDATRLQQIVWNLLSNSVKFSEAGSTISLVMSHDKGAASIVVRDHGRGITPAFLPHVFEPFRQADAATTRAKGGLGLGLAIVKYLVELHGGHVTAASGGDGQGATFTVKLPLALDRSVPAGVVAQPSVDLSGTSVLVVDDDADTRLIVATILRQCGAEVTIAASVPEAREMLAKRTPNVLITDIAMPEQDGFSLLEHVRTKGNGWSRLPVIALTAFGHSEAADRIRAAGFDAHAKKPIDPLPFARLIAEVSRSSARV